jgi:hypothetical protein
MNKFFRLEKYISHSPPTKTGSSLKRKLGLTEEKNVKSVFFARPALSRNGRAQKF